MIKFFKCHENFIRVLHTYKLYIDIHEHLSYKNMMTEKISKLKCQVLIFLFSQIKRHLVHKLESSSFLRNFLKKEGK